MYILSGEKPRESAAQVSKIQTRIFQNSIANFYYGPGGM
jgi:hypothetical protein